MSLLTALYATLFYAATLVLVVGLIFVLLNLISDLLYQVFDPRTKV